jgi:hypothetical protein|tara:strand:- start:1983 stop:2216 length:234 start_codon:yes stop_codon:yes gene_type:complete
MHKWNIDVAVMSPGCISATIKDLELNGFKVTAFKSWDTAAGTMLCSVTHPSKHAMLMYQLSNAGHQSVIILKESEHA